MSKNFYSALILILLPFSSALAANNDKAIELNRAANDKLVELVQKEEYLIKQQNGRAEYIVQFECTNPEGNRRELYSMKCFIRSAGGFSRFNDQPVEASNEVLKWNLLNSIRNNEIFKSFTPNGTQSFAGKIYCDLSESTENQMSGISCAAEGI